jgi:1-acyl-sn-glycerol-3-phosphate acyltransferase
MLSKRPPINPADDQNRSKIVACKNASSKYNPFLPKEDVLLIFANCDAPAPDARDKKQYYLRITAFRRVALALLEAAYRASVRLEVEGVEKLPVEGAVILAANHLSSYDAYPLQFSVSRPIFFMGKEELFRNPLADWILRQLGSFPVYRGERDEWAMRHARKVLEHGLVLGMFPEGSRNLGKGSLHPAKTGTARLALASNAPILPAALHGPQYMFRRFPRRTTVELHFGNLILPEEDETALSLTDRLMFAMAELLPPDARGAYGYRPEGF